MSCWWSVCPQLDAHSMLTQKFLKAGGPHKEDYCSRGLKDDLEESLLKIPNKTQEEADRYMESKDLTYKHICKATEDQYMKQKQHKIWPPTSHAHNSSAISKQFGANTMCILQGLATNLQAEALALIQNAINSVRNASQTCNNCGKPGHSWCNCPNRNRNKNG